MVGGERRHTTGSGDLAAACQYLSALCTRPVGKGMAEYGLELHSEKTRLSLGGSPRGTGSGMGRGNRRRSIFWDSRHICSTIHKSGKFTVKGKTVGKRMTAKVRNIAEELRRRINDPIEQTGDWLLQVLRGCYNYHAVPGNLRRLYIFRRETARHWLFILRRRSQRSRWTWERFETLINRYLPEPRILRPYLLERFSAK